MSVEEHFSPELLRAYYEHVFPAELMCRWLGYSTGTAASAQQRLLRRREFSFTTGDDIYIRYLSYDDAKGLRKDLVSKLPFKIDIGAVFSAPPSEKKKFSVFQPVQRELIFDIDLTDYDFLSADAGKVETCDACWPIMAVAVKVMDRILRDDFGFENLLWIYSGRRGIHCWVCDERARQLSNEGRSAVADYMYLVIKDKRMHVRTPLHPSQYAIYHDVLMPYFENTVLAEDGMAIFDSEEGWTKVLDMVGNEEVKELMLEDFPRKADGKARWDLLRRTLDKKNMSEVAVQIVFTLAYPRLDVNVSKGMNHLLKSPWCAHPKTGRVCVPFDPNHVDEFDPSAVPTLGQVIQEISDYDDAHKADEDLTARQLDAISKTRLSEPADLFRKFVRQLETSERSVLAASARANSQEAMEW